MFWQFNKWENHKVASFVEFCCDKEYIFSSLNNKVSIHTRHTVITRKASEYADKRTEDRLELQAASVAIQYKEGGNCSKEPKHAMRFD